MIEGAAPSTVNPIVQGGANIAPHRRLLTGACAVVGPGLIALGVLLHPEEVGDHARQLEIIAAHSGAWTTAHVLLWLGALLLIPAVWGILSLLDRRRPVWATTGALLAIAGCVSLASLTALEQVLGEMALAESHHQQMVALAERLDQSPALNATAQLPGLALVVGIVVLAVLWRAKLARRLTCVSLLAGIALASAVGTLAWKLGWLLVFCGFAALAPAMMQPVGGQWDRDQ